MVYLRSSILLDARRGTEKTFVDSAIPRFLKLIGERFVKVDFTAVAAQLLDDRRTSRFAFHIPIPVYEESTCTVLVGSPIAEIAGRKMSLFELKLL